MLRKHGVHVAAASKELWNNRKACGQKHRVKCVGHIHANHKKAPNPCKNDTETRVEIVDYCSS